MYISDMSLKETPTPQQAEARYNALDHEVSLFKLKHAEILAEHEISSARNESWPRWDSVSTESYWVGADGINRSIQSGVNVDNNLNTHGYRVGFSAWVDNNTTHQRRWTGSQRTFETLSDEVYIAALTDAFNEAQAITEDDLDRISQLRSLPTE